MNGILIIVSAPSGTGKTTVLKRVMREVDNLSFSVSHTTRLPREGEENGRDYFFVDRAAFQDMIRADAFLEWASVHENYYGTALAPILERQEQGFDMVLDIDVQGAAIIRAKGRLPALHIFIAPPSVADLEKRLRGRGTEGEQTIRTRLQNGIEELRQSSLYDYVVVNDTVDNATRMICGIIYAERARSRRMLDGQPIGSEALS
jgi:guanylate kinase